MFNWAKPKKKNGTANDEFKTSWFLSGKKEVELNDIDFELMEEDEL